MDEPNYQVTELKNLIEVSIKDCRFKVIILKPIEKSIKFNHFEIYWERGTTLNSTDAKSFGLCLIKAAQIYDDLYKNQG